MTIEEAAARVAKGAAHLDLVRPGWHQRVDVGTLDLSSCYDCVMAQAFGDEYAFGCRRAGVQFLSADDAEGEETEAQRLGFFAGDAFQDWRTLQDAWIAIIAARRFPVQEQAELQPAGGTEAR